MPGYVVCRLRNSGHGLTREELESILHKSRTGAGLLFIPPFAD